MNKLKQFKESELGQNPFTYDLIIPATLFQAKGHFKLGQPVNLPATFLIERTHFVKLFMPPLMKSTILNLSDRAAKLLLYIVYNIKPGKDYIYINPEHYKATIINSSDSTFLRAKKELARYGIIANTKVSLVLWVNPNTLFAGNRLKKYPTRINVTHETSTPTHNNNIQPNYPTDFDLP